MPWCNEGWPFRSGVTEGDALASLREARAQASLEERQNILPVLHEYPHVRASRRVRRLEREGVSEKSYPAPRPERCGQGSGRTRSLASIVSGRDPA